MKSLLFKMNKKILGNAAFAVQYNDFSFEGAKFPGDAKCGCHSRSGI